MRITKDMTIEDVIQQFPETIQVFSRYGVGCLGCSAAQYDNIEQGAVLHGLDTEQLVQELNACIAAHPQDRLHFGSGVGMLDTLRGDIRAVFERDSAARSLPEVLFCYPGLHTIRIHTVTATDAASSHRVGHAPGE